MYNEDLVDLLSDTDYSSIPPAERHSLVQIREDTKGHIIWNGLKEINVTSMHDVMAALHRGSMVRQTGSTDMNAQSSRSHAIFSMTLTQSRMVSKTGVSSALPRPSTPTRNKRTFVAVPGPSDDGEWVTTVSKFHFVDLAGSERLKRTSAVGERVKEGISINAGLHALGNVISALGDPSKARNNQHIPYRDSKLTRLLQDSLGGNSQTLMIACVSPAEYNLSETVNTLKYANRAKNIKNTAQINEVEVGWDDVDYLQNMVTKLRSEVKALREATSNGIHAVGTNGAGPAVAAAIASGDYGRETDLEHHLLELQDSYAGLSQRYAKLTAELAKYQPLNGVHEAAQQQSFAEAVEPVVEEYEKSISALESQLALTRAALTHSEGLLADSDSRIHFQETVNDTNAGVIADLKSRVAKLSEREKTTEAYVKDLEARMRDVDDRQQSGVSQVGDLQRELSKLKELETDREEYIHELEARLSTSDESAVQLKEQVERLEKQITRQDEAYAELEARLKAIDEGSAGNEKLLLSELDDRERKLRDLETKVDQLSDEIGRLTREKERWQKEQSEKAAGAASRPFSGHEAANATVIPEIAAGGAGALLGAAITKTTDKPTEHDHIDTATHRKSAALTDLQSQLEQLQATHKITTSRLDDITQRYDQCLAEVDELQQQLTEARLMQQNTSLETKSDHHGLTNGNANGSVVSHARRPSLSEELSFAGGSEGNGLPTPAFDNVPEHPDEEAREREIARLQRDIDHLSALQEEKSRGLEIVQTEYAKLESQHRETLETVQELREEIQRVKEQADTKTAKSGPPSPLLSGSAVSDAIESRSTPTSPVFLRRKSSLSNLSIDPVSRSLASLSHQVSQLGSEGVPGMEPLKAQIAVLKENMASKSAVMKGLEDEVASHKKELLSRNRMVEGLRKERMSLVGLQQRESMVGDAANGQSAAYAMTMVGGAVALEEKLREKEKELADLQVAVDTAREKEDANRTAMARMTKELEQLRSESGQAGNLSRELATTRDQLLEREKIESSLVARIKTLEGRLSTLESPKSANGTQFTPGSDAPPVPLSPASPAESPTTKGPGGLQRAKSSDRVRQLVERLETSKKTEDDSVRLRKEAGQATVRIAELEAQLEQMRNKMAEADKKNMAEAGIAAAGGAAIATAAELAASKSKHAEFQEKINALEGANAGHADVSRQLQDAKKEIELFKQSEQQHLQTIQMLEARVKGVEGLDKELSTTKKAFATQTSKITQLETEIQSSKKQVIELNNERNALDKQLQDLKQQHSELAGVHGETLARVQGLEADIASGNSSASMLNGQLAATGVAGAHSDKARQLQSQHDDNTQRVAELENGIKQKSEAQKQALAEMEVALANAKTELEIVKASSAAEKEELQRQVAASKEMVSNLDDHLQTKHAEVERITREKADVDAKHADLDQKHKAVLADHHDTSSKLAEVTGLLEELRLEHNRVKSDAKDKAMSVDANEATRQKQVAMQVEEVQKVAEEYRSRIADLESSISKADAARQEQIELSASLKKELERTQHELEVVATEFAQESEKFEEHEKLASQRQSRIMELEQHLAASRSSSRASGTDGNREMQGKISELENQLSHTKILNKNYRDSVFELSTTLESLKKAGSSLTPGGTQLRRVPSMETIPEEQSVAERLAALEAENVELQQANNELLLERKDLGTALDEITNANASLSEQIEVIKSASEGNVNIDEIANMHDRNAQLESELAAVQSKSVEEAVSLRAEIQRLLEVNERLENDLHLIDNGETRAARASGQGKFGSRDSGFSSEPSTPRTSDAGIAQQQLHQRVARHESTIMHQLRIIKSLEDRVMQMETGNGLGLGLTGGPDDDEEVLNHGSSYRGSMQSIASYRSASSGRLSMLNRPPPPTPPPTMPPPPLPTLMPTAPGSESQATGDGASGLARSPSSNSLASQPLQQHMSMLPLTTIKQMEEQEAMIRTLQKQLTNAEADLQANVDLVNTLESSLNDSERNLRKTRLQMTELQKERDFLSDQVQAMRSQLSEAHGEVDKTRHNIQEEKKHFETWLDEERRAKERAERSRLALENRMEELMKRRSKFMCF